MNKDELILVVDDNRVSNFFNKKVLEDSKYVKKVVTIESGKEAINFVNPKKSLEPYPSLIFLDLYMPEMNGWEFLEAYSELSNTTNCDVVVMYNKELLPEEEMRLSQYSFVRTTTNKILTEQFVSEFFKNNKKTMKKLKTS